MRTVLKRNKNRTATTERADEAFGGRIGLLAKLFGCWHKDISRPLTIGKNSYRACLICGARKRFDPETLQTYGSFHYPPAVALGTN